MAEVTIKGHTRKGKGGKTITVKGYSRRVGIKGHKSPKKESSAKPGDEFKAKAASKKMYDGPKMTKEELAAWDASARKNTNVSFARGKQLDEVRKKEAAQRTFARMKKEKPERDKLLKKSKTSTSTSHAKTVKKPSSEKGSAQIFDRVENKIAKFVEKYGGKYKK